MTSVVEPEVLRQLRLAGLLPFILNIIQQDENGIEGAMMPTVAVYALEHDSRFASGKFWGLHTNVGKHLKDFRSWRGIFGKGSLQVVIDTVTGRFHSDTDKFNPYEDLRGFFGHAFGEVFPHWLKKLF